MYYTNKSTAASQSLAAGQKRGASSVLQYDHDCQEFPYNTMLEPVPQGKVQLVFPFAQPQFIACIELLSMQHNIQ